MQPHRTRVFRSGNSQAVRLPKALGYPDGTELQLVRNGDVVTLRPTPTWLRPPGGGWRSLQSRRA